MAGQKVLALSAGIKDATTQRAVRSLERAIEGISVPAPQTPGLFSATQQGEVPASGGGTDNFIRADGSWAKPIGLNGLFAPMMTVAPTQASTGLTTWLNQPSGATVTDGIQGMVIHCPGGGSARVFAAVGKTAPTAPYTITVLLGVSAYLEQGETSTAATTTMFGWSDGTKTHAIWITPTNNAAVMGDLTLLIVGDTTFNNGSLTIQKTFGGSIAPRMWLRLKDDGTSVSIYASGDGENFVGLYTVSKAAGYLAGNYTKIVLGQDAPIREGYCQVLSWLQQ